jgi:hypothetical protein
MKPLVCVLTAATLTAGCASTHLSANDPSPRNYRQLVQLHARQHFPNPNSIRGAEIAPPKPSGGLVLIPMGVPAEAWVVCVRANVKNRSGKYSGPSVTAFLIHKDRVVDTQTQLAWVSFCKDAPYEPFPEIMQAT